VAGDGKFELAIIAITDERQKVVRPEGGADGRRRFVPLSRRRIVGEHEAPKRWRS